MKFKLVVIGLGILTIVSCSTSTQATPKQNTLATTPTNQLTPTFAVELPTSAPAPVLVETTTPRAPTIPVLQNTPQIQSPASSTATRPASATQVPSSKTPTIIPSTEAWKTYVSTRLHLAVNYPPDWSVQENNTGTRFVSAQGAIIDLSEINTQNQTPEDFLIDTQLPNTRCVNTTNVYKITIRTCLDTIAFSYYANLILKPSATETHLVVLSSRAKGINSVFDQMVASVRIAP